MAGVRHDRPDADADAIILRESRLWPNLIFGGLLAVFAVAFVLGLVGAKTAGGRVAVIAFLGGWMALWVWLWIRVIQRCGHLQIAGPAITYIDGKGQTMILSRQQGDVLRIVGKAGNRATNRFLTVQETSTLIPLNWFRIREVSQACAARGWQLGTGPAGCRR